MKKLYNKSEIWFSIIWIIIYVVGTSIISEIANKISIGNFFVPIYHIILSLILLLWIFKNKLNTKYGLCKPAFSAKYFLFYVPLIILISINFWFGVALNSSILNSVLSVISMLCVGIIEEIIFRGFLFKAMEKDSLKWAIIISSLTFGFGHIINLFANGGMDLISNICQICYACSTGFLFVIIFYRGKSLIPCIITHSLFNALSTFAVKTTGLNHIIISIVMIILTLTYSLVLIKTLPKHNVDNNESEVSKNIETE